MEVLNQAQCFASGTSTMTTLIKRTREGVNRNSSDGVRTLPKAEYEKKALHILSKRGISADCITYVSLLRECIRTKDLEMGKQVHGHIVQSGFKPNIVLFNTLVNMYAKCRSVAYARLLFDKLPERDVYTWTTMVAGYAKHGCSKEAFEIYQQMIREGVKPNCVTFICILKACASLGALEKGKGVHADIIKAEIAPDIVLETALADMYAKCGSIREARTVFDNMAQRTVVSWNVMITAYAQLGCGEAFEMYEQMIWEGVTPDKVTFICVLNECACLEALEKGKRVHSDIEKTGVEDVIVETALVDMYAKCRSMEDARQVFANMAERNVVTWSAMIAGYAQHGYGREALETYEQMIQEGVVPNKVTFTCILNACASLAAEEKGKEIHAEIVKSGIAADIVLETALVDMYAKGGNMNVAHQVFKNMAQQNVVSWNVIIAGYAQHGLGREAFRLFEQMQQEGLKPDGITYISLLSACSHVGLVDEGCHYFHSMSQDYSLTPTVEHFGCMVDLLGRAGQLNEAENFIKKIPIRPGAVLWRTLLGACRVHGNVEIAERVAKDLLKWNPQDTGTYVLLSKIYAAAGRWNDASKVRKMMEDRGDRTQLH